MQDEGTIFAPSFPNISVFLGFEFGRLSFYRPPNMTAVMALYPGLNDTQLLDAVVRDVLFRWCALRLFRAEKKQKTDKHALKKSPAKLWSDALATSGIKSVHRYTYGKPQEHHIHLIESTDTSAY
jgi:hypothetical protein